MSVTTGRAAPGPRTTLFEHALGLHQQDPDSFLPRAGEPYPDDELHHDGRRPRVPKDRRRSGAEVAAVLDAHFAATGAPPSRLADAFHDIYVPIHRNDHITAAALRADRQRVRRTGRWLVRHSTDRCSAIVGLALLATDRAEEDIPLIQTIGLLSYEFGPLAVDALQRRRGGVPALLWLAERVTGWGRTYVIEALCRRVTSESRDWLLRHACDGDFLDGEFAGHVATAAHLHEAIVHTDADDDLVDHTGRLLRAMADCGGMGMTLGQYPPAPFVLAAHAAHLARQTPSLGRYVDAAILADHLTDKAPERSGCTAGQRDRIVRQYLAVLDRQDWCDRVRADLDPDNDSDSAPDSAPDNEFFTWFTGTVAARLRLRAFHGPTGGAGSC